MDISLEQLLAFPVDLPKELAFSESNRAVLSACNEALGPSRCTLATEEEPARVRVRWSTLLNAQIDEWDGQRWRRQVLSFTEADKPSERFRAVGLLLAALASGTRRSLTASVSVDAPSAPRAREPEPSEPGAALDAAASLVGGPGVASGHFRSGFQAALGARLKAWPLGLHAQAVASFAGTSDPAIDARWLCAAAGPYGVYAPTGWLRLSLGLDLGGEWLAVTLQDSAVGSRQTRAYFTLRPWAAATVWLNRWLGLEAGAEFYSTPGQSLRVDGEFIGQNKGFSLLGRAGVKVRLLD